MILLDAYALIAFLGGETAAPEVKDLLRSRATAITTVNLAEVVDVLARSLGFDADELRAMTAPLFADSVELLSPDEQDAWRAGSIRATRYARRDRAVSLADCFLLACAVNHDHEVATSDPAVAATAREEGIALVPLPDGSGMRP